MAEGVVDWKTVAVAGISVLAGLSSTALWTVRSSDLQRIDERCEVVSSELTGIKSHDDRIEAKVDAALISVGTAISRMDAHLREADGHIRTIEHTRSRVDTVERQVSGLLSNSGARPDSYTGSDARERAGIVDAEFREVRRELKDHDRRLDKLEVQSFGHANGNGVKKR